LIVPRTAVSLPPSVSGVVVSSSLKTYSSVSLLPWDEDYISVGFSSIPIASVTPKLGPEPFPLLVARDSFASQAGRCIASLRTLGIELKAGDIVSAVNSIHPVMQPPTVFPKTSDIVFDGFCLEAHRGEGQLAGNGGSLPMLNVIGGSVANARRVAEQAVDAVLVILQRPPVPCTTRFTGLVGGAARPADFDDPKPETVEGTVRRMVQEEFALTVPDVLARRSPGAFLAPVGTAKGVRGLAERMGLELGWPPNRVAAEERHGLAFLASLLVDGRAAVAAADAEV
jgi:glycerol-3-phosphate dehydrogenase